MESITSCAKMASKVIKYAQCDLDSLLEKPGASTEREWASIAQLLRDDLVKTSRTLLALTTYLNAAKKRAPEAIRAVCRSPSTENLERDIRSLQFTAQDSVDQCRTRQLEIQNYRWWNSNSYKASQQADFLKNMNSRISQIRGYCEAIFEARTEIDEAARRATSPEVKEMTARIDTMMKNHLTKEVVDPNVSLAEIFSRSPFHLVTSRTDHQTSSQLLRIYRDKSGLDNLRKLFKEMGEGWTNEGSRTASIANIEIAHRELSNGIALALDDSIKAPTPMYNSTLDDTRSTMSRLKAWGDSGATSNLIIAIGGEFSHGKSSVLNAIMGAKFLPTGGSFVTAVPCRIVHDGRRKTASLEIPRLKAYLNLLELVKNFDKSRISALSAPEDVDRALTKEGERALTKEDVENFLDEVKAAKFLEQGEYEGQELVLKQLSYLNHLVRICDRLQMELGLEDPETWPVLSIDLALLSNDSVKEGVQFLDLPGFNDSLISTTRQGRRFAKMMQQAAEQATWVVPVVMQHTSRTTSFMHDLWKQVLNQKSWADRIPTVILSNINMGHDNTWDVRGLQRGLARTTWNDRDRSCDVLCCDSLQALAAVQLEKALSNAKTPEDFKGLVSRIENNEDHMEELKDYISQMPGQPLEQWPKRRWKELLKEAVEKSGIHAIRENIMNELCDQSPRRRMVYFNHEFPVCFDILISRHYRVLQDEHMSDDRFKAERADEDQKIKLVQEALQTLPKAVADITEKQKTLARKEHQKFKDDVRKHWTNWVKGLDISLRQYRHSDGVLCFPDDISLHKVVQTRLDGLASTWLDIQRVYVQKISSYATSGISAAIQTVKEIILQYITDPNLQTVLNNHLDKLSKIQNAVVVCIQHKLNEDTKQMYPRQVLLEMLHRWCTQSKLDLIDISEPDTPAPNLPQPASTPTDTNADSGTISGASEHQIPGCSDPERLANREVDKSGFLLSREISPEDLCALLSVRTSIGNAGVLSIAQADLVDFLEESVLEQYLNTIATKTRDTMQGPIIQTQQACEIMMDRILVDRQAEMKERFREKRNSDDRVLRHLMVWGNLVAAQSARRILFERLKDIPKHITSR